MRGADVRELLVLVLTVGVEAGAQNDSKPGSDHKNPTSGVQKPPDEKCIHQECQYYKCASEE